MPARKNGNRVVSVTLPVEIFDAARRMAKQEDRSLSELVGEALGRYQRQRQRWQELFRYGRLKVGILSELQREKRRARRR